MSCFRRYRLKNLVSDGGSKTRCKIAYFMKFSKQAFVDVINITIIKIFSSNRISEKEKHLPNIIPII
jgi:hypothetical protein